MKITGRPYQRDCVKAMFDAMIAGEEYNLISLPTGAGKTIIFSLFIEEVYRRYAAGGRRIRICVVAHREKLVSQARDKLLRVWPESAPKLGLACASITHDVDIDSEIIIGSIQTIASRLSKQTIEPFNIIIVDEAHRIPYPGKDSSYKKLLLVSRELRPNRKVIGCTATPYQLGHGYIYGTGCRPDRVNWFARETYSIGMDQMIDEGYLVPFRIKQAMDIGPELRSVPIVGGEYKADVLGNIMCRFSRSAVNAYLDYGEDRRHVVAFCANIRHADSVAESFRMSGISAAAVHSGIKDEERKSRLAAFSEGNVRVLTSVDALSEGWDETGIDCILMLRPTKSAMVYVQQAGRGMRPHPGKKDLLVLDMADNVRNHGFFSSPDIVIPGVPKKGEAPVKICPGLLEGGARCGRALHMSVMKCPECGYEFPKRTWKEPSRLTFEEIGKDRGSYSRANPTPATVAEVTVDRKPFCLYVDIHYKDAWKRKGKARVFISEHGMTNEGFLAEWQHLTGLVKVPSSLSEAEAMLAEVEWPGMCLIHKENPKRYPQLHAWLREDGAVSEKPERPRQRVVDIGNVRPFRREGHRVMAPLADRRERRERPEGMRLVR